MQWKTNMKWHKVKSFFDKLRSFYFDTPVVSFILDVVSQYSKWLLQGINTQGKGLGKWACITPLLKNFLIFFPLRKGKRQAKRGGRAHNGQPLPQINNRITNHILVPLRVTFGHQHMSMVSELWLLIFESANIEIRHLFHFLRVLVKYVLIVEV